MLLLSILTYVGVGFHKEIAIDLWRDRFGYKSQTTLRSNFHHCVWISDAISKEEFVGRYE